MNREQSPRRPPRSPQPGDRVSYQIPHGPPYEVIALFGGAAQEAITAALAVYHALVLRGATALAPEARAPAPGPTEAKPAPRSRRGRSTAAQQSVSESTPTARRGSRQSLPPAAQQPARPQLEPAAWQQTPQPQPEPTPLATEPSLLPDAVLTQDFFGSGTG